VDWFELLVYAFQVEQSQFDGRKKRARIVLGLVVTVFSGHVGYAQQRPCTSVEAQHAEINAGMFRTWDALYKSYGLYSRCDDGAIAEGFSESVARILVDRWSSLPRLASLAKRDTKFRRFVLRHVDATLNMDDIQKIRESASTRCPTGLGTVCDDLAKQANSALNEDASP
jgi:hypothetical protein